jgi:hypothetical protein
MTSSNFSPEPSARPPETMILARGQFRALRLGDFGADEGRQAGSPPAETASTGRTAFGRSLVKGSAAHGDDELRIRRFDGRDRVAGIDRAGEGLRTFDRQDVRNLHHVEQRGDARRDVLAGGRGGRDEGIMRPHEVGDQRRDIFSRLCRKRRCRRRAPFGRRRSCAASFGDAIAPEPATRRCTSPSFAAAVDAASVASLTALPSCSTQTSVFIMQTPSALSLPTSSSTSATLTPAERTGGSETLSVGQARRDIDAVIGGRLGIERLRLRLHDVGQRGIARLVQAADRW